ncbi:MAG: hypothetical protein FWF10_08030 [Clostridiales bacterium]|nr:hypothetical protein [Clostridiales bacterium]
MLEAIVAFLLADTTLPKMLGRKKKNEKWLYLRATADLRDSMLYDYTTTRNDGAVELGRFKCTVICGNMETSRAVEQRLRDMLITKDDRPSVGGAVLKCVQNGGGALTDEERKKTHTILYFDVSGRAQKGCI